MLTDLTVKGFLDKVAYGNPVPDGGSIAVLNGILASFLSMMVARLAVEERGYEINEGIVQHVQTITLRLPNEFVALIDKNPVTYNEVSACFKLLEAADEEKAARSTATRKATRQVALVPLEVARKALDMVSVIADITRLSNRNAITNACVVMIFARTAALGVLLNVRTNLSSLKGRDFILQLQTGVGVVEQTACQREKDLLDAVSQDLRIQVRMCTILIPEH